MVEFLDIYDENRNYLGKEDRKIVHEKGLWHKTVHCWLFDYENNIYFQYRSKKNDSGLYTTASGHILAGETIMQGFDREIKEEIGLDIDETKMVFVKEVTWILDREEKDGSMFRDRAWSNVCICPYEGDYQDMHFNLEEVSGIVKFNSYDVLDLFNNKKQEINGLFISNDIKENRVYKKEDFVLNKNETYLEKYGFVLESVIKENERVK